MQKTNIIELLDINEMEDIQIDGFMLSEITQRKLRKYYNVKDESN